MLLFGLRNDVRRSVLAFDVVFPEHLFPVRCSLLHGEQQLRSFLHHPLCFITQLRGRDLVVTAALRRPVAGILCPQVERMLRKLACH